MKKGTSKPYHSETFLWPVNYLNMAGAHPCSEPIEFELSYNHFATSRLLITKDAVISLLTAYQVNDLEAGCYLKATIEALRTKTDIIASKDGDWVSMLSPATWNAPSRNLNVVTLQDSALSLGSFKYIRITHEVYAGS